MAKLVKFPSERTDRTFLDALKGALLDLEGIRLFSSPLEAKHLSELKNAIRVKIASLEEPPKSMASD